VVESLRDSMPVSERPTHVTAMLENPDWIEQNREVEQLKRQRRDLLADRTPLHPEVQVVESQIARAERELATIPRQVAGAAAPAGQIDNPPPPAANPPPTQVVSLPPVVETLHARQRQLQAAGEEVERLAAQERQASEAALRLPQIGTRLAIGPENVAGPNRPAAQWPLGALLAALAAAAGVGMISHGASIDLPLRSAADVKASLPIPVVALVEAAGSDHPTMGAERLPMSLQRLLGPVDVRWPWIVVGAIAVAVAVLVVFRVGGWI
jgi:hypothetical protein